MLTFKALFLILLTSLIACSHAASESVEIRDFESCVAAGNKVLRIYPPRCVAPGVGSFTKQVPPNYKPSKPQVSDPLIYKPECEDTCGDGACAEIVCQGLGCPCAENSENCPKDCPLRN